MSSSAQRAKEIFLAIVDIGSPAERAGYLDQACSGELELRQRVEALLAAHERPESLLDRAAVAPDVPLTLAATAGESTRPAEGPGSIVGPYTLREQIGEGGMGVVYKADQAEPVRRSVALKVIKPGMDSERVLARFAAERQALALMDHPNIAKVLDAGTTAAGRPFFVMELVHGVPITRYCDEARLTPQQRLELFIPVCQAIQHAHQKGIIHRDIKPSNVLVTVIDPGAPGVPKVIDFGVAKAIDQQVTERTLFTHLGAIVGTPEYMSPEQASPTGLDVDTRSDVYSLGVLLYELLTGTTPLLPETLRRAALHEVLRRVREEEPPKPSTRLSDTHERLPSVAAQRGIEPARLARLVRGDLDWVIMKALEKDRSRRYETASALAGDIRRYLEGDPVEASPPSRVYRLRKFARKHRTGLATAAGFAALLVAATAVSLAFAIAAARARDDTRKALVDTTKAKKAAETALTQSQQARDQAEAVSKYLVEAFRKPDPEQDGETVKVVDVLNQAVDRLDAEFAGSPKTQGELLNALGLTYLGLGLPAQAAKVLSRARSVREMALGPDHPDTLHTRNDLGVAYNADGRSSEAVALHLATLKLREARLGLDHPDTLESRSNLATAYSACGRPSESIALNQETLKLRTAKLGRDHSLTLTSRNNLAADYLAAGRTTEAIKMHEETLKLTSAKLGSDHPHSLLSRNNLAMAYLAAGHTDEAIALLQETLKRMTAKLGPDHRDTLMSRNNLAHAYFDALRIGEAIALHEATLKLIETKLGPDHPDTLVCRSNLAVDYVAAGRAAEAIKMLEMNLESQKSKFGPNHPDTLTGRDNLASAYFGAGRTAEAIKLEEANLELIDSKQVVHHPNEFRFRGNLATAYEAAGQSDKSEPLFREAVDKARKLFGPEDPRTAGALALLGLNLLKQSKWSEAEMVLRECLKIREAKLAHDWTRFNTMSQLGGSLLGQRRYVEAEPLIVGGYEGMVAREDKIPPPGRARLPEAAARVVQLYEAWGKPEKAAEWRSRFSSALPDVPADPFARP